MDLAQDPGGAAGGSSYFPPQPSTTTLTSSYDQPLLPSSAPAPAGSPPSSSSKATTTTLNVKKRSPSSSHSRSSTSPTASGSNPDKDPKARRRERNRLAASAFRTRKKERLEVLEGRLSVLEGENQELRDEVGRLRGQLRDLGGGGDRQNLFGIDLNVAEMERRNKIATEAATNGLGSQQQSINPESLGVPTTSVHQSATPPLFPPPPPPPPQNAEASSSRVKTEDINTIPSSFETISQRPISPPPLLPSNNQAHFPPPSLHISALPNLPIHLRRLPSSSSLSRLPTNMSSSSSAAASKITFPIPPGSSSPQIQTHPFALSLHSLPDPTTPSLLSASGGFTPGGSRYSFHPSSPFAMGLAVSDVRSTPSPGGERGFGWGIGGGGGAGGRG